MTDTTQTTPPTDDVLDGIDFSGAYGADAAREASKAGLSFDRVDFLALDGSADAVRNGTNFAIVRFLSDHVSNPEDPSLAPWITVQQHSSVPTKAKPADVDSNWPRAMSAVCRNDPLFKAKYGDCYIDTMPPPSGKKNSRPSARTWAIAVLREEVVGTQAMVDAGQIPANLLGQVVGIRDKTKEVAVTDKDGNPTGETRVAKCYVKINFGWKNFFAPLSGIAGRFRTVLDRDIYISREGMGQNDTVYSPVALDPITFPTNHPKFPGQRFDLRDPAQRAEFYPDMPDLRRIVAEQASNAFYNRFFVPNDRLYGHGEGVLDRQAKPAQDGAATPANTPAAPVTEAAPPNADKLAALRNRIVPTGGAAPAPSAAAAPSDAAGAPVADAPEQAPASQPATVQGGTGLAL